LSTFQGILDIFKEGFARIFSGGGPRALPMWYLIPATVTFGLTHYIVSASVKSRAVSVPQKEHDLLIKNGDLLGIGIYQDHLRFCPSISPRA
jgi:hypothetical protein